MDTGRAKGNWQTTIGRPAEGTVDDADKGGSRTIAAGLAALAALPPYSVVYLTNNLPYILVLESGSWSTQAPRGMVALTLAELELRRSA